MLWWPLFFILKLSAEELSVEKYCFDNYDQIKNATKTINSIAISTDQVNVDGLCVTVSTRPHRRELIQRFLYSQIPEMTVAFSSAFAPKDPCHLKIEKIRDQSSNTKNAQASTQGVSIGASNTQASGKEEMQIQTIKEFELTYELDTIMGECRYISPKLYEISLVVKKSPKALIPNVPAGTIVIINTPPPDQKSMLLQTQLQLNRGDRIEIGSIIKDIKDKAHKASASPELNSSTANDNSTEKIFLSIY